MANNKKIIDIVKKQLQDTKVEEVIIDLKEGIVTTCYPSELMTDEEVSILLGK